MILNMLDCLEPGAGQKHREAMAEHPRKRPQAVEIVVDTDDDRLSRVLDG
jgi:hypothetical protein